MSDVQAGGLQEPEVELEEDIESQEDVTLSSLFNTAAGDDGLEGSEEGSLAESAAAQPAPAATAPNATDARLAEMQAKLDAVNDRLVESETRQNIYRMQLEREQQVAPTAEPEEPAFDYDELNQQLQANPAKAIVDLIQKTLPVAQKKATAEATRTVVDINAQNRMFEADRGKATSEFGELIRADKEFQNRAEEIYAELTAHAPVVNARGDRWAPGLIYAAMSTAYAEFVKAGKVRPNGAAGLVERKKPPISSMVGESAASGSRNVLSGYNAREIQVMKRTAAGLGISFDSYVKQLERLKKSDPSYGG